MRRLRAQRRIDYKEYSTSGRKEYRKRRPSSIRNLIQRVGSDLISEELQHAVNSGQQNELKDGAVNLNVEAVNITDEAADLTDAVFDITDEAVDFTEAAVDLNDVAAALAEVASTLDDRTPVSNVLEGNTELVTPNDHDSDLHIEITDFTDVNNTDSPQNTATHTNPNTDSHQNIVTHINPNTDGHQNIDNPITDILTQINTDTEEPDSEDSDSSNTSLHSIINHNIDTRHFDTVVVTGKEDSDLDEFVSVNTDFDDTLLQEQIQEDEVESTIMADAQALAQIQDLRPLVEAAAGEIEDFIDENAIADLGNDLDDFDHANRKIEDLRTLYRQRTSQLKVLMGNEQYEPEYADQVKETLDSVKTYIKDLKQARGVIRDKKSKGVSSIQNEKFTFLVSEVTEMIKRFSKKFLTDDDDWKPLSDDDVSKRRTDLAQDSKDVNLLAASVKDLIDYATDDASIKIVKDQKHKYEKLLSIRDLYETRLLAEVKSRELDEKKAFNKSKLNIKLPKFKGYESSQDIYTFKSNFEKIHLKETPRDMLPDILKNNFLDNPALLVVKDVHDIDEIWARLKDSFGDCKLMLRKRLSEFDDLEQILRSRDASKVSDGLSKVINLMKDLLTLSKNHGIENHLFYGDTLDKIFCMIGDERLRRWLSDDSSSAEGEKLWEAVIAFLEKELKIVQKSAIILGKGQSRGSRGDRGDKEKGKDNKTSGLDKHLKHQGSSHHTHNNNNKNDNDSGSSSQKLICSVCSADDHVATNGPHGSKLVQYFACPTFTAWTSAERFSFLFSKKFCHQCLFPGASREKGKHKDGKCQRLFVCPHPSHANYTIKKHVLVCDAHKEDDANKKVLEEYKSRCIERQVGLPDFSKSLGIHHSCVPQSADDEDDGADFVSDDDDDDWQEDEDIRDVESMYILQTVKCNDERYNVFYDSGCRRSCAMNSAIARLGNRARELNKGPTTISGVGGLTAVSPHGTFVWKLPLKNGKNATMKGVSLEKITETFPNYPLGAIEDDIVNDFRSSGGDSSRLPKLSKSVGGDTHFMIGMKYNKYFPKEIHRLDSGLIIYESMMENADGGCGVIGGPHPIIEMIEQQFHGQQMNNFLSSQFKIMENCCYFDPDVSMLGFKVPDEEFNSDCDAAVDDLVDSSSAQEIHFGNSTQRKLKKFQEAEDVGSEINFRCVVCRQCQCKDRSHSALSLKEEVEQDVIDRSVTVNFEERVTVATLPLISDPVVKLAPNIDIARKAYDRVVKKLSKDDAKREEIIQSEAKLHQLYFVDYTKNLPPELQEMLAKSPIQNYLVWNVAYKDDSVTTPARLVFNASLPTQSGYSLNDIVAKGCVTLNNLLEIFLRWRTHPIGIHSDIQKMYNAVKLLSSDWCLQRYLWQPDLDPTKEPIEKVIMTIIYGVKSSGNQAERGLRLTAEHSKEEYPDVNSVVWEDTYMDDTLSGDETVEQAHQLCDDIQTVLNRGGFFVKGFTVSGEDPDEALTKDGKSINVAGHKWYSKEDRISLDSKELNFAKKVRGRKSEITKEVPKVLTKRICASKVAENFDFSGLITPITATWKLDLHDLVIRKLDWDDQIPDSLRPLWEENFRLMGDLKSLTYQRAVIPHDAVNLDVETLEFGDASKSLVCAAIYVRFLRRCGTYSCQLLFAKSRLVPENMTQPRAELYAALLNTHSGEIVKRALKKHHKSYHKFTDSQIAFNWICNDRLVLNEEFVRNRSIEINRWTDKERWFYLKSCDMIADIGTRRCNSLETVDADSVWVNGYSWMTEDPSQFPAKTLAEINLTNNEVSHMINNESNDNLTSNLCYFAANFSYHSPENQKKINDELRKRYTYSDYIVDPNRHRFRDVVRIVALVISFVKLLRQRVEQRKDPNCSVVDLQTIPQPSRAEIVNHVFLNDDDLREGERYYHKKATSEIKHFLKESSYSKISKEIDGILYFTGRILPEDEASIVGRGTEVMKDLSATTFCVPLVDKSSPIAYSIIDEVHWYDGTVRHSGVESTWRFVLKWVYVIEGRNIVKEIRNTCQRCRYLAKKALEMSMGPISKHNITIAPAFYVCQVDLAGPFTAYSNHHKRTEVKIWWVVFCCTTTSATKIKTMDSYDTTSFIYAFTRFSCDVGYPKRLLADQGGQLIKGCETMRLDFQNLQFRLHKESRVEFDVCPVGGHNMHGKVERRIRHVKESLAKVSTNQRFTVLQWETVAGTIANSINNLPLALGNIKGDFEWMDLITPNRLLMGRNNDRCPIGPVSATDDPKRILLFNQKIYEAWFENWLLSHVPKLMEQPKWFRDDRDLKVGDVVLILKHESEISRNYQYGIIDSIEVGRDLKVRKIHVRYRNADQKVDYLTFRSARSIVVIHPVDETNVMQHLGQIAMEVDRERRNARHDSSGGGV